MCAWCIKGPPCNSCGLAHAAPASFTPAGSGKTSLLNALAGRLPKANQGRLEGEVSVNGAPRGPGFRSIAAFVQQDDVLFANLTVRETLTFAAGERWPGRRAGRGCSRVPVRAQRQARPAGTAALCPLVAPPHVRTLHAPHAGIRLPGAMGRDAKAEVVERVITHLGLAKAADTFVGSAETRGVSGGERKRVNIGAPWAWLGGGAAGPQMARPLACRGVERSMAGSVRQRWPGQGAAAAAL